MHATHLVGIIDINSDIPTFNATLVAMPRIRVRPKHHITIPARIARAAGIKPDDMLEVAYANGVVILAPAGRNAQANSLMDYAGIGRGVWGHAAEDIDRELASERASWER